MRIFIFSGAGLDAESGVETFRDSDGLWNSHDILDVCYLPTFRDNYSKCHEFYNDARIKLKDVKPNSAHYKISELSKKHHVMNYTANVTNLLEQAGCENVCHIHGEITKMVLDYDSPNTRVIDVGYNEYTPREGHCDKPGVVFFGEMADNYERFDSDIDSLGEDDIAIVVGSTLEVNPIHYMLANSECKFILINPTPYNKDDKSELNKAIEMCDVFINKSASEAFDEIEKYI